MKELRAAGLRSGELTEVIGSRSTAIIQVNDSLGKEKDLYRQTIQFHDETTESFKVSYKLYPFGEFEESWKRSVLPDGRYVWKRIGTKKTSDNYYP